MSRESKDFPNAPRAHQVKLHSPEDFGETGKNKPRETKHRGITSRILKKRSLVTRRSSKFHGKRGKDASSKPHMGTYPRAEVKDLVYQRSTFTANFRRTNRKEFTASPTHPGEVAEAGSKLSSKSEPEKNRAVKPTQTRKKRWDVYNLQNPKLRRSSISGGKKKEQTRIILKR